VREQEISRHRLPAIVNFYADSVFPVAGGKMKLTTSGLLKALVDVPVFLM
jgi:hypothetical protein